MSSHVGRAACCVLGGLCALAGVAFAEPSLPVPVRLGELAAARAVCLALRPAERVTFPGSAPQRAKAREEHGRVREEHRRAEYAIDLPWGAFQVGEFRPATGEVVIVTDRPFRLFKGALTLFDAERDEIALRALDGAAEMLVAGLAKGALTLSLGFRPAGGDEIPCAVSKAQALVFAVELLSAELRIDGKPVARFASRDGLGAAAQDAGRAR